MTSVLRQPESNRQRPESSFQAKEPPERRSITGCWKIYTHKHTRSVRKRELLLRDGLVNLKAREKTRRWGTL